MQCFICGGIAWCTANLIWLILQAKNRKDPELGRRKEAIEGDGHEADPEVEVIRVQSTDAEGMADVLLLKNIYELTLMDVYIPNRFEDRDPRTRGRFSRDRQRRTPSSGRSRDRSRDRGPRQGRRSRSRSKSNERFQGGRRNRPGWKKGPMSPEPTMPPNNFGMPPQQMYGPNVYNAGYPSNAMGYMQNQQQFSNYDYSMMQQPPPPFTAYPPPPQGVIQPMLPGMYMGIFEGLTLNSGVRMTLLMIDIAKRIFILMLGALRTIGFSEFKKNKKKQKQK